MIVKQRKVGIKNKNKKKGRQAGTRTEANAQWYLRRDAFNKGKETTSAGPRPLALCQ